MKPIPTTNAMKPAPGKGVSSFPTPVIKDTVIVEVVNAWKGDYQPLEYGTKWDDVSHASVQGSFPDHKLISQSPNSEDGQWVKRIWANDRVDQDTYNYAIKYSGGSDAHPIYIRTYVELRETYAPVPDLSPDPLFPGAFLVEEEVQREDSELDSRYVKVIRTYETLPGPSITSQRYTERGDIETVSSQQVFPSTSPDPDGLLVTQSQVIKEDVSKGTKITATVPSYTQLLVKEKKEGLLGETVTTDDIVDPATNPDALSQSVVASVVQQTSATKAVKRTTTASGPTSLTRKSNDGKLLGDVTSTQSVVVPNADPDTLTASILSSEVNQVDSGKAVKTNIVLNSTPTLLGNQTGEGLLGTRTTVESVVPSGSSADAVSTTVISSQVEPIDSIRSRKVTTSSSGPTSLAGQQKAEGLLGETTVTESIVAAGSSADSLSTTVVSSRVDPIDSAKSKKTTVVASGPTSLTQKSKDGKLLGDVTVTESIVAPDANPDIPTGVTTGILSSEIRQTDSGKAVKRNAVLNSTPTLIGSDSKAGLLGKTSTEETIVPAGTAATSPSLTVISSTVEPIDATRSRRIVVTSTSPTELSATSLVDSPVGQVPANVQQSIVDPSQQPSGGKLVLQDQISPIDEGKSQRERVTVPEYPELTTYNLDENLNTVIITEREVVSHNEPYSAKPLMLTLEDRPLDQWKTLRITSRLNNIPPTREEFKTQQFTFPALLVGINVESENVGFGRVPITNDISELKNGINKFVSVTPNLRPALSLPTRIRITTEFFYGSEPAPFSLYQISTQNVSYSGSLFSFNFGDVITNAVSIGPITASDFDSRFKGLSESITFSQSIPNYTTYQSQVGQEIIIFCDVEYIRSNLWSRTTGRIVLV